ncbi:MAG: HAD family hydrolase [Ruminococcus sp.]|nr:HAD family hydrolase [Ruminococcus sp.]
MKKLVILGFDGTIADTAPGILYCMNTTAMAMGYNPVPHEALFGVIGVSLEQGFMNIYGMKQDEIEYAMNNYSKLYSMKGEEMILLYDGIQNSLETLKNGGAKLAIVTQKNRKYVSNMLDAYRQIGELFDIVCATDVEIRREKSDMLMDVCNRFEIDPADAVFVGDSYVDAEAAAAAGVDFAAALYGWGFRSREDAEKYNPKAYINNAAEIAKKIGNI